MNLDMNKHWTLWIFILYIITSGSSNTWREFCLLWSQNSNCRRLGLCFEGDDWQRWNRCGKHVDWVSTYHPWSRCCPVSSSKDKSTDCSWRSVKHYMQPNPTKTEVKLMYWMYWGPQVQFIIVCKLQVYKYTMYVTFASKCWSWPVHVQSIHP